MNTAYSRDTQFELVKVHQTAAGYQVSVTERGTKAESFDLPEVLENEMFSEEEHAKLIAAFTIIEEKAAEKYASLLASPEVVQARMLKAAEMKKRADEAKKEAEQAEADARLAAAVAAKIDAETVAARASLIALKAREETMNEAIARLEAEADIARRDTQAALVARELIVKDATPVSAKNPDADADPA